MSIIDVTIKLPPLIINKYIKLQAFLHKYIHNPNNLRIKQFVYKKAWMTISMFEEFIFDFEKKMVFKYKDITIDR